MFTFKGLFQGTQCVLTWDNGKISGTAGAVNAFWRISKESTGKIYYGLHPALTIRDYEKDPAASAHIFDHILENSIVISGDNFFQEVIGSNDPIDIVR